MHSDFSPDSKVALESNVLKAINLGIKEICFTDHMDYEKEPHIRDIPFEFEPEIYLHEISRLKKKYNDQIDILAGVEIGLQSHVLKEINNLIKGYEFDFLLGSVHNVYNKDLYSDEMLKVPADKVWTDYFQKMLKCIREVDSLNSIGHFDLPKRYHMRFRDFSVENNIEQIKEIFKVMIDRDIALEINTGGFKYGLTSPNPSIDFVLLYKSLGGELFTIGSDSHSLDQLGKDLQKGFQILSEVGIKKIATFKNQELILKEISKFI